MPGQIHIGRRIHCVAERHRCVGMLTRNKNVTRINANSKIEFNAKILKTAQTTERKIRRPTNTNEFIPGVKVKHYISVFACP